MARQFETRRDASRRDFLCMGAATVAVLCANLVPAIAQAPIKIGVIGSGRLGGTIGGLWVKAGHPVLFSSRHPEELSGLVDSLGPLARAGTVQEAATFGEVILIAVPYGALPQIGKDYATELKGKVVMDACNAVAARDGDIAKEVAQKGVGIASQQYLPGARLVRAFNAMSYVKFKADSNRAGDRVAIPIAGDDQEALKIATALVSDAGFDSVALPLARATDFALSSPLAQQELTASELRKRLGVSQ